jgi:hypothetical protein
MPNIMVQEINKEKDEKNCFANEEKDVKKNCSASSNEQGNN